MKPSLLIVAILTCVIIPACKSAQPTPELSAVDRTRLGELDTYWAEVSRAVREGDFEAYRATVHPDGVLVSGVRHNSQPLSKALVRWKKEFDATRDGSMKADVRFRFDRRMGDDVTAYETGVFVYSSTTAEGVSNVEYVHFEALLTKEAGRWLILMEHQKSIAAEREWRVLE